MTREPLPIDPILPELLDALRRQSSVVLRAPTGAGKTTRVPPAVLDAGLGRVIILEPRRLAARAAARRMAAERGQRVGDEVGYHVRFDRCAGPRTRILVVTPGILLRLLHDDPYVESAEVLIFDEFHERSLDNDLALAIARLVQQTVRPELRLIVMSATLAVEAVAAYLGGCPIVASEGRLHPVEIAHEPRPEHQPWPTAVAGAVGRLLDRTPGDLLVFLPGLQEIRQTARQLELLARERDLAVLPLYGELPAEQQDAALLPQERRKVVLATNVAETSVTVEGVTGVIDTGLARMLVYDAGVGLDRLKLLPISRASAEQRAGRAGRTQPGVCVRLWGPAAHRARPEQTPPEIRRVDLASAVLQLLCLGEKDVQHFPWLEPPPEATVAQTLTLLRRLGAIDETVTELGRTLARLPVHPRIGRLLIEGHRLGCPERAALAAALLSERDPFPRSPEHAPEADGRCRPTRSDLLDRVEALEDFDRHGRRATPFGTIHRAAARFVLRAQDQLLRLLRQEGGKQRPAEDLSDEDRFLRALLPAFPDRVARRREAGSRRGVMVGGRGVQLAASSGVLEPELFLCIDVDAGQAETLVRQASAIEEDWLPAAQVSTAIEVAFDPIEERVATMRRVRFEDLVLEEGPAHVPGGSGQVVQVLIAAAAERLERVLPAEDSPAAAYLTRVRCLHEWMPELKLPAFDDGQLRDLLPWVCQDCRSFEEVRRASWLAAVQSVLTVPQRHAVEREAPERLEVPSGSRLALRYEVGRPPVLAVRIQEVFGLRQTPRVAAGRVRVLLHLLAPNQRPQQVTDDLASFWAGTYPQVRKELRARYPKHAWPEDPLTAAPERRPRRRPPRK
jgi:ATP-dependent helicase HrpB